MKFLYNILMKNNFTKYLILILGILTFYNEPAFSKSQLKSENIVLDKIIARINDEVIFESDVKQGILQYSAQFGNINKETKFLVFKNLVLSKLFMSKAGLNIDMDQSIINIYCKDRLKQIVSRYGGSEKRTEKGMGMSMEALRKIIRKNITESYIMELMRSKITRKVTTSNKEVKEYLENNKLQDIPSHEKQVCLKRIVKHLQITDKEKEEIIKLLKNIKKRLKHGENFEELTQQYSDQAETAANGGDIGYFWEPGESLFPKEYEDAAIKLSPVENSKPPYDTSKIIETPFGMYIIQLLKRRGNTYRTRHLLIKPKDIEGQKQKAKKELTKIKSDILNKKTTIDKEINKLDKKNNDFKFSGYIKNSEDSIRFEKNKDKLPKNLDETIYNLPSKSILGPFLISTEEGLAAELIYIDNQLESRKVNLKYDFEELSKIVLANKKHNEIKKWIVTAKDESLIYIDPEYKKYENNLWK